jgi:predicted TIM-barrel fold metal-dependent hydrolase
MASSRGSLQGVALAGQPLPCYVVDVHGHLGAALGFDNPVRDAESIVEIMNRIGVDTVCASHLLSLNGDYHLGNELLGEAMCHYPGRFVGYAVANPNCPDEIEAELERCVSDFGMKGIKVHAECQGHPIDGPGFRRMYEFAQVKGGLPVLGHGLGEAAVLSRLARDFPGVPFIVAHTGGGYNGRSPTRWCG